MWPSAVPPGVSRWQLAASFAAMKHRHQTRKDGVTPYYAHVVRVAMTVAQVFHCRDEAAIAAALLHDTIEDTTTDYDDLLDRFGAEVADIVAALTKNMALPEAPREAEYDARLAKADWRARLIKLADTYDNYCDVASFPEAARPEQRAKARERAERALALAAPDEHRPEVAAACRALRAVLAG
jgi:guanosine-3',5'-bis(diphosphate) 3'-pyrophosphohydrolase